MSIEIRDGISPELKKLARRISNKAPLLEAMGQALVSVTKKAFADEKSRMIPWPARKKPASHKLLRKSGTLWQSIRITEQDKKSVTVGSDRIYAAHQQFGSAKSKGRGSGIPARPFFPFSSDGKMADFASKRLESALRTKIQSLLPK